MDLTPIATIDRRVGWTYPPALPKWEGSGLVVVFVDFPLQSNLRLRRFGLLPLGGEGRGVLRVNCEQEVLFVCMPAFPLSRACIVRDLTPIVTIDQRVGLPLSQGRGHGVGFFSSLIRAMVLQVKTYRTLSS